MPWYAAHAIFYFRFKDGNQTDFCVWENVYLIESAEGENPLTKATEIAKAAEGDSEGTLTRDDRPAEIAFAGIRKIISVSHVRDSKELSTGDELTYSEFMVADERALQQLVSGQVAPIEYIE